MRDECHFSFLLIITHWGVFILVGALFASGLYMVGLDYYHDWYYSLPHYHKSFGMALFAVILFWTGYLLLAPRPQDKNSNVAAILVKSVMLLLIFAILFSGYLIPTAAGEPIEVFSWFKVPALIVELPQQEDIAGDVHYLLSLVLAGLVVVHAVAALKHHFVDRDNTLRRMLGRD